MYEEGRQEPPEPYTVIFPYSIPLKNYKIDLLSQN